MSGRNVCVHAHRCRVASGAALANGKIGPIPPKEAINLKWFAKYAATWPIVASAAVWSLLLRSDRRRTDDIR